MRRQPLLLLLAAIAVLLICSRVLSSCSSSASETGAEPPPGQPPAGAPAAPPGGAPPGTGSAPDGPPPAAGEPAPSVDYHQPDDDHPPAEVTGDERLDPARVPAAVAAGEHFADVWSTPDPRWEENVAPLATPALAESLVEPPPRRVTGPGYVMLDAPEWARIGVPTDRGTLVLDVVLTEGRWLVSALDFHAGDPP